MKLPIETDVFPPIQRGYIVGGSIRDLLCGRAPKDYDLAVAHDPNEYAKSLAAQVSGHVVELGKSEHMIFRVVTRDYCFDIMSFKGASIEEDLLRRDFTINAMALEISSGNLIDLTEGRQDLAAKKIRMVNRDIFQQDPVRLIRAYRLAASLDFAIDQDTQTVIARDADLIRQSAAERIREELFMILKSTASRAQLRRMADSGLLFSLFPELLQLKKYRWRDNPSANLFEQTLDAYDRLEKLLNPCELKSPGPADRLLADIDADRATLLKWSVLLRHIGHPTARTTAADGSAAFGGQAAKSAAKARQFCRHLRFPKRQSEAIALMIQYQLKPFFLFNTRQKKAPEDREFIRFFLKCGDLTPDVLLNALAVFMSRRNSRSPSVQHFSGFVTEGVDSYYTDLQPKASQPLPISGNDLINYFGMKPSAAFRTILKTIEEEHLAAKNLTRKQALKLVANLLSRAKSSDSLTDRIQISEPHGVASDD